MRNNNFMQLKIFKFSAFITLALTLLSGVIFSPVPTLAQSSCGLAVEVNGSNVDISWSFGSGPVFGTDWEILLDGNIIYSGADPSGTWSGNLADGTHTASAQYSEGG